MFAIGLTSLVVTLVILALLRPAASRFVDLLVSEAYAKGLRDGKGAEDPSVGP